MSAEIHDLTHEDRELVSKPKLHLDMDRCAGKLQGIFAKDMAGFIIFAVDQKGDWSLGWALDPESVIGRRMLCGLAVEAVREELIVEEAMNARVADQ